MCLIGVHPEIEVKMHLYFCAFFFSLVIRGEKDEQAVLCSKDKTYDMKIADTSNMLLFIPGCKIPEELNADEASGSVIHSQVWRSGFLFVCFNSLNLYSPYFFLYFIQEAYVKPWVGFSCLNNRLPVPL